MANVKRVIPATPDQVFAVLADGWTYSDWVVGTVHIRAVDPGWPAVGARIHHKAGPWPLSLHDKSTVVAMIPGRRLTMKAGLWPLGQAHVDITLEPSGPDATMVSIEEQFEDGPLLLVRNKLNDLVLHQRNVEALRRLHDLAVGARPATGSGIRSSSAARPETGER